MLVTKFAETITLILVILNLYIVESVESEMIYILQWTNSYTCPFPAMEVRQEAFTNRECSYQNCYVTNDSDYLGDITKFDAVTFNAVDLHTNLSHPLPTKRSPNQKYILVSRESSVYYDIPNFFDDYFNWTWTYRLDSDIYFGYVAVRDKQGAVIGPKKDMHWMYIDQMGTTSKYVKHKLRNKKFAVAWFVSNCEAKNRRLDFANRLGSELEKYGQKLHIYGRCGDKTCPTDGLEEGCLALIESDYYFYLSFENSFNEDYVTEKLVTPLEHFAVPVVYGGANYTRFIPDGIYLDACALGPVQVAKEINDAIRDKRKYYDFFRWHGHYSFHSAAENKDSDGVCEFCAILNDQKRRNEVTIRKNFTQWWNISRTTFRTGSCKNEPEKMVSKTTTEANKKAKSSDEPRSVKDLFTDLFSFLDF